MHDEVEERSRKERETTKTVWNDRLAIVSSS